MNEANDIQAQKKQGDCSRSATGAARKRRVEALLNRVADELRKHDGIGSVAEASEAVRRLVCSDCNGTGQTHRNFTWIPGGGRLVDCNRCYGTGIAQNDPSSAMTPRCTGVIRCSAWFGGTAPAMSEVRSLEPALSMDVVHTGRIVPDDPLPIPL